MTNFFKKLPTISYFGMPAKNFLALAKLSDKTLKDNTLFYPYTLQENDRIDLLSDKYYDHPDYAWLIWVTNNIVDPYYGMYLNYGDFIKYIEKKYTTVANAQSTIAYYCNDWSIDDSELTPSEYDALPSYARKYFEPITDNYNSVYAYRRKREDWKSTTNKIVNISFDNLSGSFVVGEKLSQKYANNLYTANAYVTFSNSTVMSVQHVTGDFVVSNSSVMLTLSGQTSGATANTTGEATTNCIPEDEIAYWTAVSYYDYENERNNQRKEIFLLDNRQKLTAENELKRVMSE